MRVVSHSVSQNLIRQAQELSSRQERLQAQVASGQRIAQPGDDAGAVGRVLRLESEQRRSLQFVRNGDRALEISQASFAGIKNLQKVSERALEVATLATGPAAPADIDSYVVELNQLIERTLDVGNSRFGDDHLFAGSAVDTAPFAATRDADGRVTAVEFAGNSGRPSVPLSETNEIAPGTSHETNLGVRDMVRHLIALRDSLTVSDKAGAATALSNLMTSEDQLISALAEQGGVQMRIEASQSQHRERTTAAEGLIAREADADLATTIVRLNQTQLAYQAALQSSANIMRISLLDYVR